MSNTRDKIPALSGDPKIVRRWERQSLSKVAESLERLAQTQEDALSLQVSAISLRRRSIASTMTDTWGSLLPNLSSKKRYIDKSKMFLKIFSGDRVASSS